MKRLTLYFEVINTFAPYKPTPQALFVQQVMNQEKPLRRASIRTLGRPHLAWCILRSEPSEHCYLCLWLEGHRELSQLLGRGGSLVFSDSYNSKIITSQLCQCFYDSVWAMFLFVPYWFVNFASYPEPMH